MIDVHATIANLEAAGLTAEQIVAVLKGVVISKPEKSREQERAEAKREADRERIASRRATVALQSRDTPSPLVPPLSPAPLSPPIIPPTLSRSPDLFEDLWDSFPRKVGKGAARKAYRAAILKTSHETLVAAVRAFASKMAGQEEKFIPHPATWLNAERWQDADLQPKAHSPPAAAGTWADPSDPRWEALEAAYIHAKGKKPPRDSKGGWTFFETTDDLRGRAA